MRGRFIGGDSGSWKVLKGTAISGEPLPDVSRLEIASSFDAPGVGRWALNGVTSNIRYTERTEKGRLDAASPTLARPEALRGCLIPISKSDAWWQLTQEERRDIFEARSNHISYSMPYLPRIARRLYHARDLGEPFDFLTWFEFAPEHEPAFDELLAMLRSREEWRYVSREYELRVERES